MRKIALVLGLLYATAALAGGSSGPDFNRGQIPGGTGTAPAAGNIGQVVYGITGGSTGIACSTNTGHSGTISANIDSLSLTAGTWQIDGAGGFDASANMNNFNVVISSTSGGGSPTNGQPGYSVNYFGSSGVDIYYVSRIVVTISSTTTYYLATPYAVSTSGTFGLCGWIAATRIA